MAPTKESGLIVWYWLVFSVLDIASFDKLLKIEIKPKRPATGSSDVEVQSILFVYCVLSQVLPVLRYRVYC